MASWRTVGVNGGVTGRRRAAPRRAIADTRHKITAVEGQGQGGSAAAGECRQHALGTAAAADGGGDGDAGLSVRGLPLGVSTRHDEATARRRACGQVAWGLDLVEAVAGDGEHGAAGLAGLRRHDTGDGGVDVKDEGCRGQPSGHKGLAYTRWHVWVITRLVRVGVALCRRPQEARPLAVSYTLHPSALQHCAIVTRMCPGILGAGLMHT